MIINDLHDDIRRSSIEIIVKNLVCYDCVHDEEKADDRPFNVREREADVELFESLKRFFNVISTEVNSLSIGEKVDLFMSIVSCAIDKRFNLFFEAGLHCGIVFCLDMEFLGQSKLFDIDVSQKIKNNESVLKDLIDIQKLIVELEKVN